MNPLKRSLLVFSILIAVWSPWAQAQFDDPLPWPWGSECPFPWAELDGLWEINDPEVGGYFYFVLENQSEWEERPLLRLWKYSLDGRLVAFGQGHVHWREKSVQLTLAPAAGSVISYQIILRSYPDHRLKDGASSCFGPGGQVMLFTLRKFYKERVVDLHYHLKKVRFAPLFERGRQKGSRQKPDF